MLLVGFFCFLRTAEMLSMQVLHVIPHVAAQRLTIIIPFSKTSNGNPQVVTCDEPRVFQLALTVLRARGKQDYLWPGTPANFRSFWMALLQVVGFSASDYTPYGIRRGGATWFFHVTASMDSTLHRGRWACARTAKMYIDQGTLSMAKFLWSRAQRRLVRHWALKGAAQLRRLRQKKALGNGWFLYPLRGEIFPVYFPRLNRVMGG